MTPGQVDTAFGNEDGQTGLSIMRMRIDPNANNRDIQVLSAQRAKSHGAILLASPWKSRRRYHSYVERQHFN